jgi:hypothetical protein
VHMLALVFSHPIGVLRRLKKVMGGLPPGSLMSPCLPLASPVLKATAQCQHQMQHGAALDVVILGGFLVVHLLARENQTAAIHPPTPHPMRKPSYAKLLVVCRSRTIFCRPVPNPRALAL